MTSSSVGLEKDLAADPLGGLRLCGKMKARAKKFDLEVVEHLFSSEWTMR